MAYLNHWIPACAGMTVGAGGQELGRHGKGVVGMATNPLRPPPSFQRRLESRKAGREVMGRQGLSDGVFGCRYYVCHSRSAGMACFNHWIPAFAGMTVGAGGQELSRHGRGVIGMTTNLLRPPSSFQRRLESRKAGRGVKGWQVLPDGALGCRACSCHSRSAGMACFNHWIPAFAGMTVGVEVRNSAGMAKGLSG